MACTVFLVAVAERSSRNIGGVGWAVHKAPDIRRLALGRESSLGSNAEEQIKMAALFQLPP